MKPSPPPALDIPVPETAHWPSGAPEADVVAEVLNGACRWTVIAGDCLDVMRSMPDASVDAVVCDPPSGIAFMNMEWDKDKGGRDEWIAWLSERMREALRVCKPGAHALVWALPRTSHWTGMAIELAGWSVRDRISHCFASGFPKSHNVSKAIDRHNGDARKVVGTWRRHNSNKGAGYITMGQCGVPPITSAASSASAAWDGYGTALKPAMEDWWLARKPLSGTIAANVLAHGTGALNIDGCRIAHASPQDLAEHKAMVDAIKARGGTMGNSWKNSSDLAGANEVTTLGRWPAHLVLSHSQECKLVTATHGVRKVMGAVDGPRMKAFANGGLHGARAEVAEVAEVYECVDDCPVKMLDEQSGDTQSSASPRFNNGYVGLNGESAFREGPRVGLSVHADSGGASRFFFTAKPSATEKEFGLEELDAASVNDGRDSPIDNPYQRGETPRRNKHPTVKSLQLMRWLCRLVTRPGGVILDPFTGSGSTGVAAIREGMRFIGAEQSEEFASFASARIARWELVRADLDESSAIKSSNDAKREAAGTLELFTK